MIRYAGIFFALAVAIAFAGRRSYTLEQRQLDADVRGQLEQVAGLKATQVAGWRLERLGDAAAVEADARLMPAVQATLGGAASDAMRRDVLAWMNAIRTSYRYATVALVDAAGRVQLLSGERLLTPERYADLARATAADDDIVFHDVNGDGAERPHLALGVTIRQERGAAIGSILLGIDPVVALYSSILQWPLATPTSRIELVAHGRVDAQPGVLMSAPKRVPDSSWYLVSRVDAAQAFAPLGQTRRQIVTVAGMLIVLCAISLGLVWRHQRSTFYRQQYEAEAELRVSRDHLERVLDAMDEGYWDRNVATGELHLSPRSYTMLGYVPGEVKVDWESWLSLMHPDDRPGIEAAVAKADSAEGAERFGMEFRVRCKSGQYIWACSRGKTVERDATGRSTRRVGVVADITERKTLEARVLQSQKLESIGRLAGGVAHDFNNLLTVINGFSDLMIAETEIGAPHQPHLQAIRQAGERGAALTQQLLAFSRKRIVQPRVVGVNGVLTEVEGLLRHMAGDDVTVRTHLGASPDRVLADPAQLHQVVMNLVVNARDAMPGAGTISIRTANADVDESHDAVPGPYVRLSVRDTGVGMDDATRALVFEPFFTTKEHGKGTGLGLSTVYGIVQQSGGFIRVDSEPGKGTQFNIYFPLAAAAASDEPVAVTGRHMARGQEPTLLVVDDDESVRRLLQKLLKDTCQVLLASDGAEAVEMVRRTPRLDAILTDLFMPNMEGFEMIGIVREMRPDVPIIAMSGAFGGEFLEGARRAGAQATLKKPFDLATLRRTLDDSLQAFPDLSPLAVAPIN